MRALGCSCGGSGGIGCNWKKPGAVLVLGRSWGSARATAAAQAWANGGDGERAWRDWKAKRLETGKLGGVELVLRTTQQ